MPLTARTIFERPALGAARDPQLELLRCGIDLDVCVERAARVELVQMCREPRAARWIVVLFDGDRFVDARGLDVLLDATAVARERGRELLLVGIPRSLLRMVEVLGLGDRLTTADSTWSAAERIGAAHLEDRRDQLLW